MIGLLVVLISVGLGVGLWKFASTEPGLPASIILTADLSRGLTDGPSEDTLSRIVLGSRRTLRDVLDALERAGDDARVRGLYLRLGDDTLGLAKSQELRDAIGAFRSKGKFALAFSESFGELGPGTRPYYLATACDEVWVQPLGGVGLTGLYSEIPFFRRTLDKLGVSASFEHRREFKSAANSLTETEMTGPQREEMEALLGSVGGQIVRGIAASRRLEEAEVRGLMDRGPFLADEAKAAGLIDRIGYRDEALARVRERAGADAELVRLGHYLDNAGRPHDSGAKIALIYATGVIRQESGSESPFVGEREANAQTLGRAFRAAARDKDVRAILLRIDSPGGSATASETIWREVVRARERGKPVIVSMGDVAASGGYYIAAPADKIVAQPATVTGSIGVVAGKIVVAGLLDKLGVTTDSAQRGANAGMFSSTRDFTPEGKGRLDAFLDHTYAGFKAHVAAGRHLSDEAVEAIAKGRVWSGEEAKAKGLVDALGGYPAALALAREAAKIPEGAPYRLVVYPKEKS
ncbi:MAG: signal peptide peptidase SppA, partial [Xanthobacteraceae bacterium]|nr:signal peptide peptidase SppA [Xanthobacteraceae bacterium]